MTYKIKVIHNEDDHREALAMIEQLMAKDPEPNSEDGEKLALLATLVENYESNAFPITLPDPVDAILFRMEQLGLKDVNLIPYIGSRSRISEILSRKRNLSIEMIRSLSEGLGIPASVLIKKPEKSEDMFLSSLPIKLVKELGKRGYINLTDAKNSLHEFFSDLPNPSVVQGLLRQSNYRTAPMTDKQALALWSSIVIKKAKQVKKIPEFKEKTVDLEFMRKVVQLSLKKDAPLEVEKFLKGFGIILIIEPHFAKTFLDGAVIMIEDSNPIIGLTLRHDRLDNFWFTLMHELAHLSLHASKTTKFFYDELDTHIGMQVSNEEKEADALAGEALVPEEKWQISPARIIPSAMAAQSLANDLGIHIAIVAGKIRFTSGKYVYLNSIMQSFKVRQFYPYINWNK